MVEGAAMAQETTQDSFETLVSKDGILLVDCWTRWCPNSDEFAGTSRQTAAKHHGHVVGRLDACERQDLRTPFPGCDRRDEPTRVRRFLDGSP
jgi:hypothetical protein